MNSIIANSKDNLLVTRTLTGFGTLSELLSWAQQRYGFGTLSMLGISYDHRDHTTALTEEMMTDFDFKPCQSCR